MDIHANAQVDVGYLGMGGGGGSIIRKLLACHGDPHKMRANDIMRKETFLEFDKIVLEESLRRMTVTADMIGEGMTYDLRSAGMGKTVLQWETASEMSDATVSMDGINKGQAERTKYDHTNLLPLYITHKDVQFTYREIEASMGYGEKIDDTNIRLAAQKVGEGIEQMTVLGVSVFAGKQIQLPTVWGSTAAYGLTNAPSATTGSLTGDWRTIDADSILADVVAMKAALIAQRHYGPYSLYIPVTYETVLDKDYSIATNAITSIRQRLLQIGNINKIVVSDFLPNGTVGNNKVVLLQTTKDVADIVTAVDPMVIPWETEGGMLLNYKVLAIVVPRMKATQAARTGIAVYVD